MSSNNNPYESPNASAEGIAKRKSGIGGVIKWGLASFVLIVVVVLLLLS